MRVAHICPFVGEQMGGSERYVFNLSKRQADQFDVHVYTTTKHPGRVGVFKKNGVTLHRFYSPIVVWNINPLALMLRDLVNDDADVFHIHSYLYTLSNQAIFAKLLKRRRALLQIHGGIGVPPNKTTFVRHWVKRIYDKSLGKATIQNSDMIASVSKTDLAAVSSIYEIPEERLRYVPNVVDTSIFSNAYRDENSEKTIIYVGDLEPWKGIDSLMNWIRLDNQWDGFEFKVVFIGQGSLMPELQVLQEVKRRNGCSIQMEVLGQRNHREMPDIMRKADGLVLPSHWEGMPTVVLEAMASGTPVISTPVGDIPSLISHKETGLLIDGTFSAFQEAISLLLGNRALADRISRNARKLVEAEFTLERASSRLQRLYHTMLT
jgi:glycosyltransferase involved in cell wall biosynthesis